MVCQGAVSKGNGREWKGFREQGDGVRKSVCMCSRVSKVGRNVTCVCV